MTKQTTILTLVLALASPVAIACNPAEGSGQCGYLGADGIYNSRIDADESYQRLYNQNTYVEPAPVYRQPPPPPTHDCTARAEGGKTCFDIRPGHIGSSFSINAAGDNDGPQVESYPDGTPRAIYNYRNGKAEGESTFFYPDGTIESVMHYQNDELNGSVQHFHPNGTLSGDMTYCNGETCGEERDYDEQGNLVRIIRYDANGNAASVQEITPGSQPGAAKKSRRKS
ncbi:toxin-antitoxin system YwqK family antitoxin [Cardiobacterium hominis]|uniref:toxin-antitoxin system YwqK family antitoxin n=1 Tax=Cardiobacterium hominis TaxID=2718 RepID=UPI0028E2BECA|nr:toxin-antitoxin system YwqK family antitoxin [Cardiobacterium hominis]